MNKFGLNREKYLIFLGGVVFSTVFTSFAKTKTARKLCVNAMVKGMLVKDEVENTIAVLKEEAEDMYVEAKQEMANGECSLITELELDKTGE